MTRAARYFSIRAIFAALILLGAAGSSARAAKYAGEAFSLGAGARGMALGGAVVAGPFDGFAPYWNPAGMARVSGKHLSAMHAETFGSLLNHDVISYVSNRSDTQGRISAYGFYLYYLGGGGIKITQLNEFERPYVVREESHGDYIVSGGISGQLNASITYGLAAKVIYRDIGTETGIGLTLDLGALYSPRPWLDLGLTIADASTGFIRYSGKTFDSGSNSESIYPTVKPGIAFKRTYREFIGRLLWSGDIKFEDLEGAAQYWAGPLSLDAHYGLEIGWRDMVFGRAGFDIGRFTAGAGVDISKITIDVAYLHHADLDETFRVSAGYRF
uniref:PorV/PorQ family protein n=1 Tax=uncultured bacterium pAW1 TaxID=1781155 RepID=A0A1C9U4R4_9BACT|nr:hypothetical protein RBG1 [uncultured bacterium pAW1]